MKDQQTQITITPAHAKLCCKAPRHGNHKTYATKHSLHAHKAIPSLLHKSKDKSVEEDELLCHSRDVHLTWVKSFTGTLSNKGLIVLSTKSEED